MNAEAPDECLWHRRFAAAGNNRAWELSEQSRDAAQDLEMLNAAHASAWRWAVVANELNRMRATMLLAHVHALLGFGRLAWSYAEEMREYFLKTGAPDAELAFVHAIHAHAAAVAGETAVHRASHALAVAAIKGIASEPERQVLLKTFIHVPSP